MKRALAFGAGFFLCALAVGEGLNALLVRTDRNKKIEADGWITLWPRI